MGRARKTDECDSHGGQGVESGEGSWCNAGDPVVIQWQETHWAQTRKRTIVNAGDLVAPQHPGNIHNHIFSKLKFNVKDLH